MSARKEICAPAGTRRRVRLPLALFSGQGLKAARASGFLRAGDALVCGPAVRQEGALPAGVRLLRLACSGRLCGVTQSAFYLFGEAADTAAATGVRAVAEVPDADGEPRVYLIGGSGIRRFFAGVLSDVPGGAGGSAAAFFRERLFTAGGSRLCFSRAGDAEDWEHASQGAGEICLPSAAGEILALVPFDDDLYLFRERGITRVRVPGDNLNFRALDLPCAFGGICASSVACCGKEIVFFADDGVYALDGACRRICPDFRAPGTAAEGTQAGGIYYAAVVLRGGGRALFRYDPQTGETAFLPAAAETVAGGAELYFAAEGKLCRLVPPSFSSAPACRYESEFSSLGLSCARKRIGEVCVEGSGRVEVGVYSDGGDCALVRGRAGELLKLPSAPAGNAFRFRLRSADPAARFTALTLRVLEESDHGY